MTSILAMGQLSINDLNDHVNVTYSIPPPPINPTPGDLWFNTYNLSELDTHGMPCNNAMYYYDNTFNPSLDTGNPKKKYYPKISGNPTNGYWVLGQDAALRARVYYSNVEPTATETYNIGDMWVNTATGDIYIWSTPSAWDATISYNVGNITLYTDGHSYYAKLGSSLDSGVKNIGRIPAIGGTDYWSDLGPRTWSSIVSYSLASIVYYSGRYYSSLVAGTNTNLNHTPTLTQYWTDLGTTRASWVRTYAFSDLSNLYSAMADDGILSRVEKPRAMVDFETAKIDSVGNPVIGSEGIIQKARAVGVSATGFEAAYLTLYAYIVNVITLTAFQDTATDTVLPADGIYTGNLAWSTYWQNYFTEKTKILLALQNAPIQYVTFVIDSAHGGSNTINLTTNTSAFAADGHTGVAAETVMLVGQTTTANDGIYSIVQQTSSGGSLPLVIPPPSFSASNSQGAISGTAGTRSPYTVRCTTIGSNQNKHYTGTFNWVANSNVSSGTLYVNFTVTDSYLTGERAIVQYSIDGGLSWNSFDGTLDGIYFVGGSYTKSIPGLVIDLANLKVQVVVHGSNITSLVTNPHTLNYITNLPEEQTYGTIESQDFEVYVTISDVQFTSSVASTSNNWALARKSSVIAGTVWSITNGTYYGGKKWKAGLNSGSLYLIDTGETVTQLPWAAITARASWLGAGGATGLGVTNGASLDNIGRVSGSTGHLRKTGTDTWDLDTTNYGIGSVTSVTAGTGLTGGTITTSGTLSLVASGVSAASYTHTSLTVDTYGRITAASSGSVTSGTVTSVGVSVPTGLEITAGTSPVSSSGTIAIVFSSGYSIPTTTNQTNWNTAYSNNHAALTLGTSQNGLSLSSQVLSLGLAGSGTTGALSSTNWSTFNGKQDALSGGTGLVYSTTGAITYLDASTFVRTSGDQSIGGTKTFTGVITPSVGSTSAAGLMWPTNPGTGSGDAAWMRYWAVTGETTKLQIGIDNDADDALELYEQGAVRLSIAGGLVTIGSLTVTNTITGSVSGSAGSAGYVTSSLSAGSYLTWSTGTTFNGSAASTLAVDATSANTASKVVARDGSGNFSAGTVTVNSLTVAKVGTDSLITFPAQTNDPAYIKHYESNNTAIMYFNVSDDANDNFHFGYTSSPSTFILRSDGVVTAGAWNGSSISTTYTDAKVTAVNAGTGIGVSATTGSLTVSNSGVLSVTAGGGISVSQTTGALTVTNSGITSVSGTSPISTSTTSGQVSISISATIAVPVRFYYEAWVDIADKQPLYRVQKDCTLTAIRWFRDDNTAVSNTYSFPTTSSSTTFVLYKYNSSGTVSTSAPFNTGPSSTGMSITLPATMTSSTYYRSWQDIATGMTALLSAGDYLELCVTNGNTKVMSLTVQLDISQAVNT